ncbi:MAG: DUF996 domain-containing protein [Nitrososphaerota archaeon]
MNGLGQAKILGGVGSLLMVLSIIPNTGPVLYIVGLVLVLIAVKQIADILKEQRIFNNVLTSVILGIVGLAVGAAVGFAGFFSLFRFDIMDLGRLGRDGFFGLFTRGQLLGFAITFIIALVVVWIFLIVSSVFLRRGLTEMGSRLGVGYFGTAGLLFLIGSVLVVVLVGFIIIFVASIILTVAFFSLPEHPPS